MKINPGQMRGLRQLHLRLSDGRDLHRPGHPARHHQSGRMRGMLRLLQRLEPGASESDVCPHRARSFSDGARAVRSRAGCLPHRGVRAGQAEWPRVVRRAFSDPRVPHESTGVHGRGTEEVKTNDVSGRVQAGEAGFHDRVRPPGRGRVVPRYPENVLGAGARGRRVRKEESGDLADERRRDRDHPGRHPR